MSSPIVGFVCWLRGLRRRRAKHTPVRRIEDVIFQGRISSSMATHLPAPSIVESIHKAMQAPEARAVVMEELSERERDRRIFRALYAACPTHLAKLTDEELEAVRAACLPEEEREENHAGAFTGPPATDDGDTRVLEGPRDTAAQIAALLREGRASD